jgi:hypothetical protein
MAFPLALSWLGRRAFYVDTPIMRARLRKGIADRV